MKIDISNENVLMIIAENGFEVFALSEWYKNSVGFQVKCFGFEYNEGHASGLLIANTEEGIDFLNNMEPEDEG